MATCPSATVPTQASLWYGTRVKQTNNTKALVLTSVHGVPLPLGAYFNVPGMTDVVSLVVVSILRGAADRVIHSFERATQRRPTGKDARRLANT
jgi:hypothetical protein